MIVRTPLKDYERHILNRALDMFEDSHITKPNGFDISGEYDDLIGEIRKLRKKIARYEKLATRKKS